MKKLYYFLLLLPLWGSGGLSAQVSVELTGKTYTMPPQVSFTVSWGSKAPYNNKIWMLAQYTKVSASGIGAEDRALVTEVSATGATASTVTGHRGFWLETSGSNSSATVTATLKLADGVENFNWCVYAFDYPPNAVSQPDGTYQLRGSLPFTINGNISVPTNTFGPGTCIMSFTDATNNPEGIVPDPPTIAWASGGEAFQSVLIGNAVIPITFVTAGATSVTTSGLSNDVSGTWASPDYTVSGTPSATGTIAYTLTTAHPNGCTATISGTITVVPPGANQQMGSCTFTQPDVVNTFTAFPATYSASTFVTLVDERDGNNYTVVKMPDGKWWMAQNLNYQKDLTWQTDAAQPSTTTGQNTALIGHFWCPGATGATTSTLASCDVWGALYSFETAMMVDGKWSDDSRTDATWEEVSYSNNTTSGNTNNGGKGAGRHGICPAKWHVPTDAEWGNLLNAMETSTSAKNHNSGTEGRGAVASSRIKSKCAWTSGNGTDTYGFRAMPAGFRQTELGSFAGYGGNSMVWSASAANSTSAWRRDINNVNEGSWRAITNRARGYSVRCIQN
jgi:uncharacterized protein (TIGR02145 family)